MEEIVNPLEEDDQSSPGQRTFNYFNYFTEIEEHFQRARGTGLFLLSPLDWALIETWKNSGVPLEAVLRGIDVAFENWRKRRSKAKVQMINSLAYCAQAVLTEAQKLAAKPSTQSPQKAAAEPPFSKQQIKRYLEENLEKLQQAGADYQPVAEGLQRVIQNLDNLYENLEELEQHLTTLEEKMIAIAKTKQLEEELLRARQEFQRQIRPYRSRMNTGQLAMLEKQFLERKLLEERNLPRLSLFYM